jgi:hypothetical protein
MYFSFSFVFVLSEKRAQEGTRTPDDKDLESPALTN